MPRQLGLELFTEYLVAFFDRDGHGQSAFAPKRPSSARGQPRSPPRSAQISSSTSPASGGAAKSRERDHRIQLA
jgi:hypothetical protein